MPRVPAVSDGKPRVGKADTAAGADALGVAEYIEAMSTELGAMAADAQLRLLHYLLEMVRLEAEAFTRRRLARAQRQESPTPRPSAD